MTKPTKSRINESREWWRCRLRGSNETRTLSFVEASQIRALFKRCLDEDWSDEEWVENFRKEFDIQSFYPSDEWVISVRRGMEMWDIVPLPCF